MRVWTSHYDLIPRKSLNSRTSREPRRGALLRFDFENGQTGFADLHPWAELGDEPLFDQLRHLKVGRLTTLTERSLEMARADAEARTQRVNLFEGLSIPRSHYLLTEMDDDTLLQFVKLDLHQAIDA